MKNAGETVKHSGRRGAKSAKILLPLLAVAAIFCSSCKAPPTPPRRAPGTPIALNSIIIQEKKEKDFKRLSEYFTYEENTGGNAIARSDPANRDGIYFILNIEIAATIPSGSVATLRYFCPHKTGELVQTWTLPEFFGTPTSEIMLGLTTKPVPEGILAWHIEIVSPEGEKLIERSSFLWLDLSKNQGQAKTDDELEGLDLEDLGKPEEQATAENPDDSGDNATTNPDADAAATNPSTTDPDESPTTNSTTTNPPANDLTTNPDNDPTTD